MASKTIRTTFALDHTTARLIEQIAIYWAVSKSEALRRMVRFSREQVDKDKSLPFKDPLSALEWLQNESRLSAHQRKVWEKEIKASREDWGKA